MLKKRDGFTIVELLIVVVVIAVLAAITIIAFNGMQARAAESAVKSDLKSAATVLAGDNVVGGSYPSSLSAANSGKGIQASSGNSLTYSFYTNPNDYCLSGTSARLKTGFRVTPAGLIETGVCAGHVSGGGGGVPVALSKPAWSTAQVSSLLTTPVNTTLAGKQFNVAATMSAGTTTGSHIDGNDYFAYTVDGVPSATTPTPDMQIATNITLTVRAAIQPGSFDTMQVFVSDAEWTSFKVYVLNESNARLSAASWLVQSQESNGTVPASNPNPYTKQANEITFTKSPVSQNEDTMRIIIDRATLDQASSVVLETVAESGGDWVQWAFMGRAS